MQHEFLQLAENTSFKFDPNGVLSHKFFNESSFVTIAGDRVLVIAENVVGWEGFLSIDEIWIWVQTFT